MLDERQEQRERQILEDREAARLATFRLEQILQNQEISAQEREFAISQLNEAKAIAAGERDEDKRRFLEERDRKEIERDFMVQEYQQSKAQRADERAFALARQDNIINQIMQCKAILQPHSLLWASLQRSSRLRKQTLTANTNVALATIWEMSTGRQTAWRLSERQTDPSRHGQEHAGDCSRGEIAGRIANEYTAARQKARDDAIKYITGQSRAMTQNVNDIIGRGVQCSKRWPVCLERALTNCHALAQAHQPQTRSAMPT